MPFRRPKHAKIPVAGVHPHDVAQQLAQRARGFSEFGAGLSDLKSIIAKIRYREIAEK